MRKNNMILNFFFKFIFFIKNYSFINIFFSFLLFSELSYSQTVSSDIDDWKITKDFKLTIDTSGYAFPTAMAFVQNVSDNLEDPLYYVLELNGTLKVVTNEKKIKIFAENIIPNIAGTSMDQSGAAGLCLDHSDGSIFVTYAYDDVKSGQKRNAIIKFYNDKKVFQIKESKKIIMTELFENEKSHSAHQIGPCIVDDHSIYVSVGYGLDKSEAQNLNTTLGSVIRMNKSNFMPLEDNPFFINDNNITSHDYIWAYGFRNIFGLVEVNDEIFYTQNGGNIDTFGKLEKGKNYLWDGTDISIAASASYVFSPSQGLVSITYIDNDNNFPKDFKNKFYIISSGSPGEVGPGKKGKNIWVLDYDLEKDNLNSSPFEFVKFDGNYLQLPVFNSFFDNSLYFFGIMPNNEFKTNIYKIKYLKNFNHSNLLKAGSSPIDLIKKHNCTSCHVIEKFGKKGSSHGPLIDLFYFVKKIKYLNSKEYENKIEILNIDEKDSEIKKIRNRILESNDYNKISLWLKKYLINPQFDNLSNQMPNLGVSKDEARIIANYLLGSEENFKKLSSTNIEKSLKHLAKSFLPDIRYRHLFIFFIAGIFVTIFVFCIFIFFKKRIK